MTVLRCRVSPGGGVLSAVLFVVLSAVALGSLSLWSLVIEEMFPV